MPSNADMDLTAARRELIDRALWSLPEDLRLLVTLCGIQALNYQEIAMVTDMTIGAVASRMLRARRQLRPMLEPLIARRQSGY